MYGTILKLDCARQNRIDPKGFLSLFKSETQKKIMAMDTKAPVLNSSLSNIEPTMPVHESLYPNYFGKTMLRTILYNIQIHGDIPRIKQVFINKDASLVFEFEETVTNETADRVAELFKSMGYTQFTNPEKSGKRLGFDIDTESYTVPDAPEVVVDAET